MYFKKNVYKKIIRTHNNKYVRLYLKNKILYIVYMTTDINVNSAIIELANSIRVSENNNIPSINYKFFKDELPLYSDECWAKIFYDLNNETYIYNQQHNTWFHYDDDDILKQCKKQAPMFLNDHISKCLQHLLTTEFNKIKLLGSHLYCCFHHAHQLL